ncbi:hypothetical protein RF11_14833 [Thelohanellus kitauei]|uniref:Uncharacterized protein n=1 Tax=Thelohanellus kitauei TaxID=669202 RepID=A0A0C2IYD6_THEKT|nr:hypothetical protein RF11_14833 [Thelohanellus kitauei]
MMVFERVGCFAFSIPPPTPVNGLSDAEPAKPVFEALQAKTSDEWTTAATLSSPCLNVRLALYEVRIRLYKQIKRPSFSQGQACKGNQWPNNSQQLPMAQYSQGERPKDKWPIRGKLIRGRPGSQGQLARSTDRQAYALQYQRPVGQHDLHGRSRWLKGLKRQKSRYRAPVNGTTVGTNTSQPGVGPDLHIVVYHLNFELLNSQLDKSRTNYIAEQCKIY